MYKAVHSNFYSSMCLRRCDCIITAPDYHLDFKDNIDTFFGTSIPMLSDSGYMFIFLSFDRDNGYMDVNFLKKFLADGTTADIISFLYGFKLVVLGGPRIHKKFYDRLDFYSSVPVDINDPRYMPFTTEFLDIILGNYTKKGDLVLDPFMGTNSVGKWCLNNDRGFFGIDKDKVMVDNALEYYRKFKENNNCEGNDKS